MSSSATDLKVNEIKFEKARKLCCCKIYDLLKSKTTYIKNSKFYTGKTRRFTKKILTEYSNQIEDGVYKYAIGKCGGEFYQLKQFKRLYMNKLMSIYLNLNPDSIGMLNRNLIIRLFNGEFIGNDIAFMSPDELFPEHWKEIKEKHDNNEKYIYSKKFGAISSTELCYKCKVPNTVTYYSLQTRSIDEPDTIFYICTNKKCGNRWKN